MKYRALIVLHAKRSKIKLEGCWAYLEYEYQEITVENDSSTSIDSYIPRVSI